jgi:hypothetical protein
MSTLSTLTINFVSPEKRKRGLMDSAVYRTSADVLADDLAGLVDAWNDELVPLVALMTGGVDLLDHGSLTGLGGDDHLQYIRVDGTRAFTGTVSGVTPTQNAHLATKKYVDDNAGSQGTMDHGALSWLSHNDHPQYLLVADIDDTPVDTTTNAPISSNWAFDHVAAADPHTGYRLENTDHTHQSTGAQAGKLDHGLALTGLGDDDHSLYHTDGRALAWHAGVTHDHGTLSGLSDDDHGQYLTTGRHDVLAHSGIIDHAVLSGLLGYGPEYYHLTADEFALLHNPTTLLDPLAFADGGEISLKYDSNTLDVPEDGFLYVRASGINHADLANLNSVNYTHLSAANHTDLTDNGDSTLHYHPSDRDSANFSGVNWTDLTDGGLTTLHTLYPLWSLRGWSPPIPPRRRYPCLNWRLGCWHYGYPCWQSRR